MANLLSFKNYEVKIALIYLFVSVCWIFFSDRLADLLITDREWLVAVQTYKGWGFVGVTTFVLYYFVSREAVQLRKSQERINQLLKKEKKKSENLEQDKEQLEEILLEVPSAICILEGPDHRFKYANEEYYQMVGNRELVGLTVREALPELEGQKFFKLLDKVYETGELYKGKEVPFTIRTDTKKKTYYRNFIYKPLFDQEGNCTGIFTEAVDVTEQVKTRKALEKSNELKQILLSELHHRVKNNLALIIGLIELEADKYTDDAKSMSLETTRNRIFAIAEIHELLYQQQSLKNIPFQDFLHRLRDILFDERSANGTPPLKLNLDILNLNVNQAVPLGLMVNEIMSRLKNRNGQQVCTQVELSLRVKREKEVNLNIEIHQLKQQVKRIIFQKEKHLTSTLLEVLSNQLGGTLNYASTNGTDSIHIRFKKQKKLGPASNL